MNPPPEATYKDVDALKAACRQHAAVHLYSVTTKRSDYKMGVLLLHYGKSGTRDDRHGLIECHNPNLAKCGGEAQHLEKLGIWSPPGLPNVQSSTERGKKPRIGVFLVSLERS